MSALNLVCSFIEYLEKLAKICTYPFRSWVGCFKHVFSVCGGWRSAKSYPHLESPVKSTFDHDALLSVPWLLPTSQLIWHTNQEASNQHPTHHVATAGPESLTRARRGYTLSFWIVTVLPWLGARGAQAWIGHALSWTGAEELQCPPQSTKGLRRRGTKRGLRFKPICNSCFPQIMWVLWSITEGTKIVFHMTYVCICRFRIISWVSTWNPISWDQPWVRGKWQVS